MGDLEKIAVVLVVALAIILIVYGERSVTTHWIFWVGIVMLLLTFLGIPAGMLYMVRNL